MSRLQALLMVAAWVVVAALLGGYGARMTVDVSAPAVSDPVFLAAVESVMGDRAGPLGPQVVIVYSRRDGLTGADRAFIRTERERVRRATNVDLMSPGERETALRMRYPNQITALDAGLVSIGTSGLIGDDVELLAGRIDASEVALQIDAIRAAMKTTRTPEGLVRYVTGEAAFAASSGAPRGPDGRLVVMLAGLVAAGLLLMFRAAGPALVGLAVFASAGGVSAGVVAGLADLAGLTITDVSFTVGAALVALTSVLLVTRSAPQWLRLAPAAVILAAIGLAADADVLVIGAVCMAVTVCAAVMVPLAVARLVSASARPRQALEGPIRVRAGLAGLTAAVLLCAGGLVTVVNEPSGLEDKGGQKGEVLEGARLLERAGGAGYLSPVRVLIRNTDRELQDQVLQFGGRDLDPDTVAASQNVAALIFGSVWPALLEDLRTNATRIGPEAVSNERRTAVLVSYPGQNVDPFSERARTTSQAAERTASRVERSENVQIDLAGGGFVSRGASAGSWFAIAAVAAMILMVAWATAVIPAPVVSIVSGLLACLSGAAASGLTGLLVPADPRALLAGAVLVACVSVIRSSRGDDDAWVSVFCAAIAVVCAGTLLSSDEAVAVVAILAVGVILDGVARALVFSRECTMVESTDSPDASSDRHRQVRSFRVQKSAFGEEDVT